MHGEHLHLHEMFASLSLLNVAQQVKSSANLQEQLYHHLYWVDLKYIDGQHLHDFAQARPQMLVGVMQSATSYVAELSCTEAWLCTQTNASHCYGSLGFY